VISASAASSRAGASPPADRAIVLLRGALDTAAAPALRDRLIGIIHRGTRLLILDLSRVLWCDPAGLAVLIGAQRRARLLGVTVCLAAPSLPVANMLRSTGLDRRFTMYPDLSSALAPRDDTTRTDSPAPARRGDPKSRITRGCPRKETSQGPPSPPAANCQRQARGLQALRPALPGRTSGERQLAPPLSSTTERRIR
jgi:anti-anti-sigma factor